jgi:hypothetical protein
VSLSKLSVNGPVGKGSVCISRVFRIGIWVWISVRFYMVRQEAGT